MSEKPKQRHQLEFVCYEEDVYHGLPMMIHIRRIGPDWYTKAACGKKGNHAMAWYFNTWIFEQATNLCQVCYDKLWPIVHEDQVRQQERGQ